MAEWKRDLITEAKQDLRRFTEEIRLLLGDDLFARAWPGAPVLAP